MTILQRELDGSTSRQGARTTLVIVGNGMTSWRLCHELMAGGAGGHLRIVVIGREAQAAYDRVRLTSLLGGASVNQLLLAEPEWYARAGIELHLGESVVDIDRAKRLVRSDRRVLAYDRLVLATGSVPFVPPIPGVDRPGVFVYRTIADLEAIRSYGETRRRALVIGGGLLGLEAAKAVLDLGLEVTVVESLPTLMPRQLDAEGGERLAARIRDLGVAVHTGRRLSAIAPAEPGGQAHLVHFADGGALPADLVIVAAGVRPATDLARAAGLELGPQGGISVDDMLRTSDENIYAVGECASHRGALVGLVAPGYQMVRVLAANLAGRSVSFQPTMTGARLKLLGVDVGSIGEIREPADATDGTVVCFRRRNIYRKITLRAGCLTGALAVGPWPAYDRVAQAVAERERVSAAKLRRFRRTGELGPSRAPAATLPSSAIVCSCMQVTRGQIDAACGGRAGDTPAVCRETAAASMCGSCRPLVEELVALASSEPPPDSLAPVFALGTPARGLILPAPRSEPGAFVLVVGAAVALVVTGLLLAGGVLPSLPFDWPLPRAPERTLRLVTGYGALGLAAASLLLPLRKRWRRFAAGSVAGWRAVHGLLGASTIFLVVVHTGMHRGVNLDQAILLGYSAVVIVGAFAGIVYGSSRKLPVLVARRQRLLWTRLHLWALAPLPALAALHILAAYYY